MNKKNKVKTCTYNKNRHVADTVNPYCTWTPINEEYPPHIYWSMKLMTEDDCYKCKVYEEHFE